MAILEDVDAIVADCRSLLDEKSDATNKFWVDAEIIRWANEGAEKFTSFTRTLSKYYDYVIESADIHDGRELRLNLDFITFDEGGVIYNDKPIGEISLLELNEYKGDSWREHTATVAHKYYRRGDYIGFYPNLNVGDTVRYFAIERTPPMVASDAVKPLSGDYRMIAFRPYIRDYAMSKCWYKKGEFRLARELMNEFKEGITFVNQVVHGEKNQVKRMIPARQRRSRYTIDALNM